MRRTKKEEDTEDEKGNCDEQRSKRRKRQRRLSPQTYDAYFIFPLFPENYKFPISAKYINFSF